MDDIRIHYQVSAPEPENHLFDVTLEITGTLPETLDLKLPGWTPGSYLMRDYSRHVGLVQAQVGGKRVSLNKTDKASWQVALPRGLQEVQIQYQVYAYELTVRSGHLDTSHGYFNGTTLFLYHEGWKDHPVTLEIVPPDDFDVACPLDRDEDRSGWFFHASSYDQLVDSPVEMGHFTRYRFEVESLPHELVVYGEGYLPAPRLLRDLTRIIEKASAVFGGLPYHRYLFILHLSQGGGGLEHRNSTTIQIQRFQCATEDGYQRVLHVFAHEFFHLWNVKRLRPNNLGPFDYQHEVYTPMLWALEGLTDYYAGLLLLRSQTVTADKILESWAKGLKTLFMMPARKLQTVAESSFDAWIKYYRPDANSPNSTISYYLKGALIGLFLDLEIRQKSHNSQSLDSVFQTLWQRYGENGYPAEALEATFEEIGGAEIQSLLQRYIYGHDWFDESVLSSVGLVLSRDFSKPQDQRPVDIGVRTGDKDGRFVLQAVLRGGAAERGGLAPDDQILALDGIRVEAKGFDERLSLYRTGDPIRVSYFRRDQLSETLVVAEAALPDQWRLVTEEAPSEEAQDAFRHWAGVPLPTE